jgi:lipopolysaccharide export system permease protein
MRILRYYILRQHLVPFLLGFGVVTFILEMDVLFDYLDLVVNRGVAVTVVAQLFLLSLGYIVALSVPCAVLVAVLMTFGRLSQDNEITALRASGVNLGSVLIGPLSASVVIGIGLVLFNNYVLPESNHAFAGLLIDIGRMRPTVKLQEGVFVTDFPGYNLLVRSVNGRTNEMRGVTLYQMNPSGPPTIILANKGFLSYTPDGRTAVLELKDGEIHEVPSEGAGDAVGRKYRRMVFKAHVIHIAGAGGILERSVRDARSDREMSGSKPDRQRDQVRKQYDVQRKARIDHLTAIGLPVSDLERLAPEKPPWWLAAAGLWSRIRQAPDAFATLGPKQGLARSEIDMWKIERDALRKRIAGLSVEIHKKFSLPASCIVFVLIGAPLGMRVRRAGPAVAFVSVAFFLFYYLCLVGGEELANRLYCPPWLAMWLANIVIGVWGVNWTLKACELRRRRTPAAVLRPAA